MCANVFVMNPSMLDIIAPLLRNNIMSINPGDAHYIFMSTCKVIMDNAMDFICWPEGNEYRSISEEFRLPYTIGRAFHENT